MLSEISIKNFAIIDDLKVNFDNGLNVLTGETGAGKSIIIDALMFALGCRASQDFIKTGCGQAEVEAVFEFREGHPLFDYLSRSGVECEKGLLIFKRAFTQKGKNLVFINNRRCTLSTLAGAGEMIVDIHGQNTHQQILKEDFQLSIIDSYGNLAREVYSTQESFEKLTSLRQEHKKLSSKINEIKSQKELLLFQTDEIDKAQLKKDEDEELEKERAILKNALSINDALSQSLSALYESESSAFSAVSSCASLINEQAKFDEKLLDIASRLKGLSGEIDDISREIQKYTESLSFDESRLNDIEERLFFIQGLKRKYSASVNEIIEINEEKKNELESIDIDSGHLVEMEKQIDSGKNKFHSICKKLSLKRKETAFKLEKEICRELSFLEMDKVKFKVEFKSDLETASQSGMDKVLFLISTNPGESPKPLSSVASGGELSRFMLAIRSIIAKFYDIPVVIFDEIDAGIGGVTAEKVGQKLKDVSTEREVLCITHFPQIAKFADSHYQISKVVKKNKTSTKVKKLSREERVEELARMLGGNRLSDISKQHAKEMLKQNAGKSGV